MILKASAFKKPLCEPLNLDSDITFSNDLGKGNFCNSLLNIFNISIFLFI